MSEPTKKNGKPKIDPKLKAVRKNAVLTVLSNFMLALAIGSVGSGIAQLFTDFQDNTLLRIAAICFGLVFLGISSILVMNKELENEQC